MPCMELEAVYPALEHLLIDKVDNLDVDIADQNDFLISYALLEQTISWNRYAALLPLTFIETEDRCIYYTDCGQDVQRLSVVTSLPHLLRDNRDECLRRVIPKIREFLPVAQQDMQLAASTTFLQILQNQDVPIQMYSQQFLPIILNSLDHKDAEVAEAWLETLLEIICLLPKEVLRKDVLSKAIQKGQISQSIQSRLMSCKILGKISVCLESFVIKREILPLVQSLCQDVEYEVRACMCRQLDLIAKGMGLESTKSAILPELVELANDEESSVRLAGLDTVVSILSLLDDETCASTIIPLVVKFCQGALQDQDSTLPVVSKHLGKLCYGLSPNMSAQQKSWFIDFYKKLCTMGLPDSTRSGKNDVNDNMSKNVSIPVFEDDQPIDCRVNAAYNFPALTLFAGGPSGFDTLLYDTFSRLCRDPSVSVRKTMAHGFHEVARTVGSHVSLLIKDLVLLFKDEFIEVLSGLTKNLSETVDVLSRVISSDKNNGLSDLMAAILSCEVVISASNDWRLQEQLLDAISTLTRIFSSDQIYGKLVPMIFNKLHTAKALPVRLAAVRTSLLILRVNKKAEQRQEMCQRIVQEFAKGKSFRNRTLFIDICITVLEMFSRAFFKEYFYEALLELSSDPVPNIRLRLCSVLPSLKRTIRLPVDRNLLQQLESNVRKLLINERDRDVLARLKTTVDELDRINCMHDSINSRRNITDEDAHDMEKEKEEQSLIELEEKEKKEDEADAALLAKKKAGNEKKMPVTSVKSKGALDKSKSNLKDGAGSKIPTAPPAGSAGKEPRKNSIPNVKEKVNPSASLQPNGSAAGNAAKSTPSGVSPAAARATTTKTSSSGRNIGSASSVGGAAGLGSAGSTRNGKPKER